jgi:hypothetical protein
MYKREGFLSISIIPQAISIIEKYGYKLPIISGSKMNKYIKEVGEIAGINDVFRETSDIFKEQETLLHELQLKLVLKVTNPIFSFAC